ncbi:GNAT family N-acetyltransferase [Carnobacterium sp. CS13]|uniref:GNAT family N-acetyltransferase n=1 Tax=Carnobacterium sp. CS13 TaxID=2800128 RepID=UPI0019115536|nr:GNAT family protein [Carnobacterium sp. CS13]QQP70096.1 GNAT family N-acetyltransferase [Carnobacterium sp. CS13]
MKHSGTQPLETERLFLRRIALNDAEDVYHNWASDEEVTKHLTWKPHNSSEVTIASISNWQKELEQEDCYRWCIELKENQQVIGTIDVVQINNDIESAVIGYCMSKDYWNKGIMTEAFSAIKEFLFECVGFNRIEASHHTENPGSGKVMEKVGMNFEGIKREGAKNNEGNLCDIATYAMFKSDWENEYNEIEQND